MGTFREDEQRLGAWRQHVRRHRVSRRAPRAALLCLAPRTGRGHENWLEGGGGERGHRKQMRGATVRFAHQDGDRVDAAEGPAVSLAQVRVRVRVRLRVRLANPYQTP